MLSFNWKRTFYFVICITLLFSTIISSKVNAAPPIKAVKIDAGIHASLAVLSDGNVIGWGRNNGGNLNFPVGLSEVVAIDIGGLHTLALKSDGTVVSWGLNTVGQTNVPVGLNDVVSITVGGNHSLALKSDGTVVAWGDNAGGQSNVPSTLDGVTAIAAGENHSLALKSDGTVVAWGNILYGKTNVPTGLDGVVGIAAGGSHSLALKSDGTLVTWGSNQFGQSNVSAVLGVEIVAIAAGENHSLALKSDGTVVAWGLNASGQADVPTDLDDVVSIASGTYHSLALKSDGTVVAWGYNANGQINVPGNANLSNLTLQEGEFTESFDPSVTDYTYYYDGQSLTSVHVTPTLASSRAALYVDGELLPSGSTKTIDLSGVTTETSIPVRVEPYLLPGQTYTITLAIDATPPEVQFGTNGRVTAEKTAASSVTVSDTQSGVDAASLDYVWTQSTAVPSSGWLSFSDIDTLSHASGSGNWYLHIRATDHVGNATHAVSNPFVLDNTAPNVVVSSTASSTVNAAFPVTVTFSEDVSGFISDELVVVNGIASDFVAENSSTYTATITPVTSGENVTVAVEEAAATDAAGNDNTASNTLSLLYDTTKPVVAFGGFTEGEQFTTPPTEIFVSVSELVYWVTDDTPLLSSNAFPLLSMNKDGQEYADYTPSYDETSRTFTLTFNDVLDDGDYEVHVAGNVVRNENNNTLDAVQASFTVAVPVVTSLTTNPTSLISSGGHAIVTVTGSNLTGQTIAIYVDGVEAATANITSADHAEATISLPRNLSNRPIDHRLTAYLNGIEVAAPFSSLTVAAAPASPSVTLSNDANLANIHVSIAGKALALAPTFTPGTKHYTVEIDAEQVELELFSADSKAVMKLQGEAIKEKTAMPLALGTNVLTITVQAEDGTRNTYTLTITRIPTPDPPTAPICSFTDIDNHWAQSAICEAAALGIVQGVDSHTFVPNGDVTRTEFAVMLMRTLQIPINDHSSELSFSDKESIQEWARLAIKTAVVKGILHGYSDGTLRPEETVSRAEMAAMVAKVMNWKASNADVPYFTDDASIPAWAKAYVAAARENGLLDGREGNRFDPNGRTTRAEATIVLLRLWKAMY